MSKSDSFDSLLYYNNNIKINSSILGFKLDSVHMLNHIISTKPDKKLIKKILVEIQDEIDGYLSPPQEITETEPVNKTPNGVVIQLNDMENKLLLLENELKLMRKDPQCMFSAHNDGYYFASITYAGSIVEAILREIWKKEKIKGNNKNKTIEQLLSVIVQREIEMDRVVEDYIKDIQRSRNRAAHGEEIFPQDSVECIRKLTYVVCWYFNEFLNQGSGK